MKVFSRFHIHLIVLAIVAAACSPGSGEASTASPSSATTPTALASVHPEPDSPLPRIVIAAPRSMESSPVWIGVEEDLYTDHGLRVDVVPTDNFSDSLAALETGSADAVVTDVTELLEIGVAGQRLQIVSFLTKTSTDSDRNSMTLFTNPIGDWVGCGTQPRTVGVASRGSLPAAALRAMSASGECSGQSITVVEGSPERHISGVQDGWLDGVALSEPFASRARTAGLTGLVNLDEQVCPGRASCPVAALVTTDEWASKNQETLTNLRSATAETLTWIDSEPLEFRASLISCCAMSLEEAASVRLINWAIWDQVDGEAGHSAFLQLAEVLRQQAALSSDADPEELLQ